MYLKFIQNDFDSFRKKVNKLINAINGPFTWETLNGYQMCEKSGQPRGIQGNEK